MKSTSQTFEDILTYTKNAKHIKNVKNYTNIERRYRPVPQSITGLVEPGKKNPTIFFFTTYSYLAVTKVLLIQDLLPLGYFWNKEKFCSRN
jgi:hypothetical protein